jgi:hypothetical protein
VAGALPGLVRLAPGDEAAEVRATGREDVSVAGLVAVSGLKPAANPDDGAFTGRESRPFRTRTKSIGEKTSGHAGVLGDE